MTGPLVNKVVSVILPLAMTLSRTLSLRIQPGAYISIFLIVASVIHLKIDKKTSCDTKTELTKKPLDRRNGVIFTST